MAENNLSLLWADDGDIRGASRVGQLELRWWKLGDRYDAVIAFPRRSLGSRLWHADCCPTALDAKLQAELAVLKITSGILEAFKIGEDSE